MTRLRFTIAAAIAALTLALFAAVAEGGGATGKLGSCANSYEFFARATGSVKDFRAALLCLINEARASQKLPALKRSAELEHVAQAQSNTFARTGSASHGSSLSDIGARFAKVGYRSAAYDEAFDDLDEGATPYLFLSHMLGRASIPCSEIFDPRFRDVGIGATVAPVGVDTLALEFGLRAGKRQASSNARPSQTCPHKTPAPVVSGMPVVGARPAPTANGSTVDLGLHCTARVACVLTSRLTLPDAQASADSGSVTIPAGASKTVTYTFAMTAVTAELAASNPNVSLSIDVTAPVAYAGTISGPLS
jgi:uncharacterized protein YkwD